MSVSKKGYCINNHLILNIIEEDNNYFIRISDINNKKSYLIPLNVKIINSEYYKDINRDILLMDYIDICAISFYTKYFMNGPETDKIYHNINESINDIVNYYFNIHGDKLFNWALYHDCFNSLIGCKLFDDNYDSIMYYLCKYIIIYKKYEIFNYNSGKTIKDIYNFIDTIYNYMCAISNSYETSKNKSMIDFLRKIKNNIFDYENIDYYYLNNDYWYIDNYKGNYSIYTRTKDSDNNYLVNIYTFALNIPYITIYVNNNISPLNEINVIEKFEHINHSMYLYIANTNEHISILSYSHYNIDLYKFDQDNKCIEEKKIRIYRIDTPRSGNDYIINYEDISMNVPCIYKNIQLLSSSTSMSNSVARCIICLIGINNVFDHNSPSKYKDTQFPLIKPFDEKFIGSNIQNILCKSNLIWLIIIVVIVIIVIIVIKINKTNKIK